MTWKEKKRKIKLNQNKIKIGESEISVYSPIKGENNLNSFGDYVNVIPRSDEEEKSVRLDTSKNKNSILYQLNTDLLQTSSREINNIYADLKDELNKTSSFKKSTSKMLLNRESSLDMKLRQSAEKNCAPFTFIKEIDDSPKKSHIKSLKKNSIAKSKNLHFWIS